MWFLIVALALGPAMLSLNTPEDSTPAEAMEILLEDCDKSEYAENLVNYLDYILLGSAGYWDGELHLFTDMVTGKRPQRTSEDEFYNHAFLAYFTGYHFSQSAANCQRTRARMGLGGLGE